MAVTKWPHADIFFSTNDFLLSYLNFFSRLKACFSIVVRSDYIIVALIYPLTIPSALPPSASSISRLAVIKTGHL